MRRRDLLRGSLILSLGCAPGLWSVRAAPTGSSQRVRPSDPEWPSASEWAAFGRAVHGNLLKPTPLLSDCIQQPTRESCAWTLKQLRNPYFIGDQVSGTQVSGWLDAWEPATSRYAVACRAAADVVAAVNFGRKHNLRLVVKGAGHSYQGTSNAPDSLLIWTHPMRKITLHDHFVGKGCQGFEAPSPAVTIEAGAIWMDIYEAVTTRAGRYVQGGGCTTVGVAGLVQSGGFGTFSKRYGTAAASLLEADIVTADGKLRTVNSRNDPDLLWALKGGGGGTWGVVTKVTLRTHELPKYFGAAYGTIKATSDSGFRKLIARFVDFYSDSLFNEHWGAGVSIGQDNTFGISMLSQGLSTETARKIWHPFFEWVASSPKDFALTDEPGAISSPAREWWDAQARRRHGSTSIVFDDRPGARPTHAWWRDDQREVGLFLHAYDSAWLPAELLSPSNRDRLAEALFSSSRHMRILLHFNKGLAGAAAEAVKAARATATNPLMLDAFALAIIATGGGPRYEGMPGPLPDDSQAHKDAADVERAMAELHRVNPSPGSYVSESNFFNRRWQEAFWGDNYARLLDIKRQYDPDGLFFVHHGVGSEQWSPDGFTRLSI
jgi:FAD/FMN-containing dehydrogenase